MKLVPASVQKLVCVNLLISARRIYDMISGRRTS